MKRERHFLLKKYGPVALGFYRPFLEEDILRTSALVPLIRQTSLRHCWLDREGGEFLWAGAPARSRESRCWEPACPWPGGGLAWQGPQCGRQPPLCLTADNICMQPGLPSTCTQRNHSRMPGGLFLGCRLRELPACWVECFTSQPDVFGTRWNRYEWFLAGVLGKSYLSSDTVYSNVFLNYFWCFAHYTISVFGGQR